MQGRGGGEGVPGGEERIISYQLHGKHCAHAKVPQAYSTLCDPMDWSRLLCPWDPPGKSTGVGCYALLQGIIPRSPALQADSLPSKPPGKPKNTVGVSLSLLQENLPAQESNWGLLH